MPTHRPHRPTPRRAARTVAGGTAVNVGGRDALVFTSGRGSVRVGMVLPVIERIVDVTAHPSAARTMLWDTADGAALPRAQAEAMARRGLREAAGRAGAWEPGEAVPFLAALGGVGHPLLAAAYREGAAPIEEVPRWAVEVLTAATVREGAAVVFGRKATRPVVAALARSLAGTEGAVVDLAPLAVAMLGRDVLDPDRLARVLSAAPPAPADHPVLRPPRDQSARPSVPDRALIEAGRVVTRSWGAARTERVLVDALVRPDGLRLLAEAVRYSRDLGDHVPARLPRRLADLHAALRVGVATDHHPPAPAAPPLRPPAAAGAGAPGGGPAGPAPAPARLPIAGVAAEPVARAVVAAAAADAVERRRVYAPPAGHPQVTPTTRLEPRPTVAALHGVAIGAMRVVVPRTCGDLARWSVQLSNCLDGYGPAAAAGQSTIIGVERQGALRYALELYPATVISQFVGPANRPPPDADRIAVVEHLVRSQVIDPSHPGNRIWISGTRRPAR